MAVSLTVYRNDRASANRQPGVETAQLTSDFVRVRLLWRLSQEDRAFL